MLFVFVASLYLSMRRNDDDDDASHQGKDQPHSSSIRSFLLSSIRDAKYQSFLIHLHTHFSLTMIPKFYFLLISTSFASNFVKALPTCPNNTITWFPCNQNGTFPHTCGNLSVPLDYSNSSSSKTFNLSLVKVPAVKEPRQGSILFNPGGPGIAGTRLVTSMGGELLM